MAENKEQISEKNSPQEEQISRLEAFTLRHHLIAHVIIHAVIFTIALFSAFMLWFDANPRSADSAFSGSRFGAFLHCLPFFLILKLIIFGKHKLFLGGWQYASIRDVTRILRASWWFTAISFLMILLFVWAPRFTGHQIQYLTNYFARFPNGVLVLDFLSTVFFVCTARLGFRIYRQELRPIASEGLQRVLIVGAGNAAEAVIREIERMRVERFRVIGMVDDDPSKEKILIHGVPVLGKTDEIREICEEYKVGEILVAMPSATHHELQRVIDLCSGTKLKFRSLPAVSDLIDGKVTVSQMKPVDIDDLLGRDVVELDDAAVSKFCKDKRILITGAGGSIGSEMCRQVCKFEPSQLILVEQAETPMFDIENELRKKFSDMPIAARICDIYDRQRVMEMWNEHRPEVVIHAAAHKHVPLMEHNPCEAIKNNILGSKNVADASIEYETEEFVMISTDKAVNPSSVMGCSKRVAELYTQGLNERNGCITNFKAVRFGNVLGSNGSVIPTFRRQIANGGPVTVTHPEMTRYFMTIPEAARLVLQAAATGQGGQIFLLDMGEPVKIVDLARQMITLSGFRPGEDIEIVFSGVRPGEKLFEELKTDTEDIEPTVHPKVNVWKHTAHNWDFVQTAIEKLSALQNTPEREPIIQALREVVPEYEPLNPPKRQVPKMN